MAAAGSSLLHCSLLELALGWDCRSLEGIPGGGVAGDQACGSAGLTRVSFGHIDALMYISPHLGHMGAACTPLYMQCVHTPTVNSHVNYNAELYRC